MPFTQQEFDALSEYESAAEWCAKRNLTGGWGDPLPNLLSTDTMELINGDIEAFKRRVKDYAYAHAMEHTTL